MHLQQRLSRPLNVSSGIIISCIWKVGSESSTEAARVMRPAFKRHLSFQPLSLLPALISRSLGVLMFLPLCCKWKRRYLPKSSVCGMPRLSLSWLTDISREIKLQLAEIHSLTRSIVESFQTLLDKGGLIVCCLCKEKDVIREQQIRNAWSHARSYNWPSCSHALMVFNPLCKSPHKRTNKYEEKGSPCLRPWFGWMGSVASRFQRSLQAPPVIQFIITAINLLASPTSIIVSMMNGHSILSYAFSRSNLITMAPLVPLFCLIKCNCLGIWASKI